MKPTKERVVLNVKVEPMARDLVKEYARLAGMTLSEWIERAIYLATAKESAERAVAAIKKGWGT